MSELSKLNKALSRLIAKEKALFTKMAADGGDTKKNETLLRNVQGQRREALASAAEAEYEESQKEKKKKDSEKKKKDAKERPAKSVKLKSLSNKGSRGGVGSPLDLSKGDMRRYAKTLGSKPLV